MGKRIVFVGAGNLATRLAVALKEGGFNIEQVYSRTASSADALSKQLQSGYTNQPEDVIADADIYIVALSDSAVSDVLPKIKFGKGLVVHCSGSLPISLLSEYSSRYGVLYPLQTFSKNRKVDFSQIPVFIEGCTAEVETELINLASSISEKVTVLESEKRQYLHVAAVFACNFVNHFYTLSADVLKSQDIDFNTLLPLIRETTSKVSEMSPTDAQTGPAVRYDTNIIDKHLELLEAFPKAQILYKMVSESIYQYHNKSFV